MLRKFRININGKEYLVEMEELGVEGAAVVVPAAIPAASAVSAAPVPALQPAPAPAPIPAGDGLMVEAPMPGNVLSVQVKVGDQVTEDQVLIVLEAMKMENEIVAPKNGVITAVYVEKGTTIDAGKPIVMIG